LGLRRPPRPSLDWLLVFVPISLAADAVGSQVAVFVTSALAIVPLAGLIGRATEQAAIRLGPRRGGLLNATLGNLTELIVAVLLIFAGDFAIVKASLVGSIIGNLLLVLGLSFAVGGVRHPEQEFSARAAAVHSTSLLLAVAGLVMPALFIATTPGADSGRREALSLVVAAVLILLYLAALAYTQVTHAHLFHAPDRRELATWTMRRALIVLLLAALAVGLESELLVSSLRPALQTLHVPALFAGLIIIPIIGNAAEHASAVAFAAKDRLDATMEIAVGSSTQIALFVAPALVFISILAGHPMDFVFATFEIAVVTLATLIVGLISLDGRTNWLEGVQLLGAYCVIAAAALFVSG
jgi:Ca2+:H+ antiporter